MTASHVPDPKHAQLLGAAIIAWSNVAERLEHLFVILAELDNPYVVAVFVKRIKDAQMDDVASSLAGRLEPQTRDAIRAWVRRVSEARKQRNRYLHSVYTAQEHSDGQSYLYLLGQRVLDRDIGIAEPSLDKLLSHDLIQFRDEAFAIQRAYDEILDNYFPFVVRVAEATDEF